MSSTWFPTTATCNRCGKPEHGSLACDYAPGWPQAPEVEIVSVDGAAPGGVYWRIAEALERIATALEQNQDPEPKEDA